MVTTSDEGEKVRVGVSTDWCITVEHWRSSFIGDARGFSGKTPIALSRGFSVEILTRVTPS